MPQLIQPGLGGPGTADVLDGYLYVIEGANSSCASAKLGAAVNMPGYVGIRGTFGSVEEAIHAARLGGGAFAGARHLVWYRPTVYEAVKDALVEAEKLRWVVTGLRLHEWFFTFGRHLLGASLEEIYALMPGGVVPAELLKGAGTVDFAP